VSVTEAPLAAEAAPVAAAPAVVEAAPEAPPVEEAAPISDVAPAGLAAVPAPPLLIFPRMNLDQGCAPRVVFKCAIPVAESCSPAPRRTSVRPLSIEYSVSEHPGPRTVRGLG
jgi:hypothetical protein